MVDQTQTTKEPFWTAWRIALTLLASLVLVAAIVLLLLNFNLYLVIGLFVLSIVSIILLMMLE